jgi:hypothetical protein
MELFNDTTQPKKGRIAHAATFDGTNRPTRSAKQPKDGSNQTDHPAIMAQLGATRALTGQSI